MASANKSSLELAAGSQKGIVIRQYNMNFTSGQEIAVDYSKRFTTMGQMFFDRQTDDEHTDYIQLR